MEGQGRNKQCQELFGVSSRAKTDSELELSNVVSNIYNSVWICSRCKSLLKKHKLLPFALVNNMSVPPVPVEALMTIIVEEMA